MKKITYALAALVIGTVSYSLFTNGETNKKENQVLTPITTIKKEKTPIEQKYQFVQERLEYELDFLRDPQTGEIPRDQQILELQTSLEQSRNQDATRASDNVYVNRGPGNLGGRTRSLAIDMSDPTGNTMLAGAVSGGVFRTINGGNSWTKVSPNSEIHNVTAIAQDPRDGFQNIWYYATGENLGNSASLGSFYPGQGVWRSEDGGLSWEVIPETDSAFEVILDSFFDVNNSLAVSPINGDLFIASFGRIHRYDGTDVTIELQEPGTNGGVTDVKVNADGRVFASIRGSAGAATNGVYTSETGNGSWVRIAQNGDPMGWQTGSSGRIVLGVAPSNTDLLYALYTNGNGGAIEADLWRYDLSTDTWTDFSSTLPDEPGGDLGGNDPFAVQGGYDLVVNVKPDDENFVTIGGTNVYKIADIENDDMFTRIGGYRNNQSFALYDLGGGATHHPDVHFLLFDPSNSDVFFTGTDGGIHRTDDVNATPVAWTNLNNDYQTYQYYHVALDPVDGSDFVFGGAQDNGTTFGGTTVGLPNLTNHNTFFGGDGVAVGIARRGADADIEVYFGTQNGNISSNLRGNIRPTGTSSSIFVTYFHLDPDSNTLYYADGDDIFRANNAQTVIQSTWTNIGSLSTNENIRSIASTRGTYSAANSFTLIGGENGGVFRHDDPRGTNLSTADNITPAGASTAASSIVSGVAIHPTNPDIGMVVYSNYGINNIYVTSNLTAASPTWTLAERNLSIHSIRSAAITEVDGVITYFVGTARGLYSSTDPINIDWALQSPDQIGLAVISSLVYRPSDGILLIGTHGNGMYQVNLDSCPTTTTYTVGGGWDNGAPTASVRAVIDGNYDASVTGDITACTLTVNGGATLTIPDGNFISVLNDITVNGTLNVSNEGSVVQVNEAAETFNNGTISVQKVTPIIDDRNYVSMSSPMSAETRDGVYGNSRAVFSIIPSNFVPFNIDLMAFPEFAGAENFLDDNNDYLLPVTGSTALPAPGIGQLVFPQPAPNVGDGSYTLTYTQGTLNSGTITVPVNYNGPATVNNYNLLGNPYASAIDVTAFINANDAVNEVYYWDHITNPNSTLPGPGTSNFSMNDISIRNAMMGTAAVNMGGPAAPGQYMSSGQGFGIKADQAEMASNTPVVFTNSMRVTGNNDGFRNNEDAFNTVDKLWLNITTSAFENAVSQAGIGFTDGATAGYDAGYDTKRLGTFLSLFTNLDGEYLAIQGREAFDTQMELSLGFSTIVESQESYTISIDHFEGGGLEEAPVFLIDNVLNTITNLKESPYTFTATKGIQPDRFIVVFEEREVLSTEDEVINENDITVYPNPGIDEVTLGYSGDKQLQELRIVSISGQIVQQLDLTNFNQSQQIDIRTLTTGIYFMQIVSEEETVIKKLIVR